jgi:hypothetical protein
MSRFRVSAILLTFVVTLSAGERYVSPLNTYFRVYAIVPMTGSGTAADPVRPMYVPVPSQIGRASGIIGFNSQLSEDGKTALIEIVARDKWVLAKMLADRSIQTFVKRVATPAAVQSAFQPHKASFNFATFDEVPAR